MKKRPKRVMHVLVHWVDIEGEAGWGEGAKELPVVLQSGFVHTRPNARQKHRYWKIKTAQVEEEPGGMVIIPESCVVKIVELGWVDVPWRE